MSTLNKKVWLEITGQQCEYSPGYVSFGGSGNVTFTVHDMDIKQLEAVIEEAKHKSKPYICIDCGKAMLDNDRHYLGQRPDHELRCERWRAIHPTLTRQKARIQEGEPCKV